MERLDTSLLRALLVVLAVGLAVAAFVLHLLSLDSAAAWPEYAHLRLPTYLGVVGGLVPVLVGIGLLLRFLSLVDAGEAFSAPAVRVLRQVRLLIAGTAVYFVLGLVVFHAAFGQGQPGVVLMWLGLEVGLLLLLGGFTVVERLFRQGLELREDAELTV